MHFSPAQRPGYSGVGLFSRRRPDRLETSLGESRFDTEGRLQLVHFGRLALVNGYFPKGTFRAGTQASDLDPPAAPRSLHTRRAESQRSALYR